MKMKAERGRDHSNHGTESGDVASLSSDHRDNSFVSIDGERYYVVANVDRMSPFLMSIVSDGDRWMFLSSSGGVTAGRRNVRQALFPYETDDRLHHLGGLNGAQTAIRGIGRDVDEMWRPMSGIPLRHQRRTLYKSVIGDSVIFEEQDEKTGLIFRYRWKSSDRFGFIRTSTLINGSAVPRAIELIDGLRNILPHGLDPSLYLTMGNLTNAYKRSEMIDADLRLAVYSLESMVTDRPEPAEALRSTVTWSDGLEGATVSLHPAAASTFGTHERLDAPLVTGMPGAYFLCAEVDLEPGESKTWSIVSDVGLDQSAVTSLIGELRLLSDPTRELNASMEGASQSLLEMMARADALERTADEVATSHHFSNVTYNVMRGGIPMDGYIVDTADFGRYLERRNRTVARNHLTLLSTLDSTMNRSELLDLIDATGDADLRRLGRGYLPFSFSRRHGDPSRPWNAFSIRTVDEHGNPVRYFEGNWRDIFQNWEAMSASFPMFLPDIVSVFVDASTPDGFNPYRITSNGIDWEVPEPDDPWSNIGYWGDHQIVYLLRLLEATDRYLPGTIRQLLGVARFAYADVPYRIAPYELILDDPKATIEYDEDAASTSAARVESVGSDGKLVWRDGAVYHVTLAEKLVVPALAKLSNFVAGGGIWMNTQRPEWNDANNALVGYGLSMVTLYQLRAYLDYIRQLVAGSTMHVDMSREVADWLGVTTQILSAAPTHTDDETRGRERKRLMEALGTAFSEYRRQIYGDGFTGTTPVPLTDVAALCEVAIAHLDGTIATSRRDDGLYDSYNLIHISDDGGAPAVEHLGEMLEGQVAVIESGVLDADQCADVVDALFESAMYRADQHSFMLYPAHRLPSFLERNIVPQSEVEENPLLSELLARRAGAIITRDDNGNIRFDADVTTRETLEDQLDLLAIDEAYQDLVHAHRSATIRTYSRVFGHHSYTGRSGSMHGYEGLGSIYWHMVAKLLVAVQESTLRFVSSGARPEAIRRLVQSYWRVRSGMGFNKTPLEHGAIPIDPYSHTPAHAGAQQPGMTGLVKEELLVRPGELGVLVADGEVTFDSTFLATAELLHDPQKWLLFDTSLEWREIKLPVQSLGSTVCQVPIVVICTAGSPHIDAELFDGQTLSIPGDSLGTDLSSKIFNRTGEVTCIQAFISPTGERSTLANE
jgi:hypothetical protein